MKELFKKLRFFIKTGWSLQSLVTEVKDKVANQPSPFDDEDDEIYTCLRNREGFCLYIPQDKVSIVLSNPDISYDRFNLINVTALRKYSVKRNIIGEVYNKTNPPIARIKVAEDIKIKDIRLCLIYSMNLSVNDELYADLVNYHQINDNY